jgi:hypothetical protein
LSVSDEPHLAARDSSADHVDQIGRKAGRGLTWSLVRHLGNSFVQLSLAGGAGMIVYVLVVVPLDKLRQVTALRAHFR